MGNTATVNMTEETKRLEITEKLVRDFQYHVNLVDRSMAGFARSIDTLRASCANLQQRKNDNKDSSEEDTLIDDTDSAGGDKNVERSPKDALLLETIDDLVSDHKYVLMESLSKLFSLITDTGLSCCISIPETVFAIDKYMHQNNLGCLGNGVQYCDARLQSMQKKIKAINDYYQLAKTEIENFNRREEIYHEEKEVLNGRIEELENIASRRREEVEDLINEKNTQELEKEDLKTEMIRQQSNVEKMRNEITEKELLISSADKNQHANSKKIEEQNRIISVLNEEINNLKSSLQEEQQMHAFSMEEKSLEIKSLTNELEKQNKETKDLQQKHDNEMERLTEMSRQEQKINAELLKRLEAFEDTQRKYFEDKRYSDREFDEKLMNEVRSMSTDVKGNQKQIEALEEKQSVETERFLTKTKEFHDAIEKKQVKLEEIKTCIEALQQTNINLQSNLKRERELSESKMQEVLSTQLNYLNDEMKQMNTEYTDLKQLFKTLTEQEETSKEELKTQIDILKEELQQYNRRKENIDKRLNHVENEYQILSTDIRESQLKTERLEEKHRAEFDKYLKQLVQEKKEQAKEIEIKTKCFEKLVETNLSLQRDLRDEKNTSVSLREENISHKNEIEKKNKDFEELKQIHANEFDRIQLSLDQEKNKNEDYLKQLVALEDKQRSKDERISQLNDEKKGLATDVNEKERQLETLQIQLELATRKILHVQVFYLTGFHAAAEEKELASFLKMRMATECIDLQFLNCTQRFSPLSTELPLVIVCSRNFKITRDRFISSCLKGIKETKKTALLIFQERDEKSLRKEVDQNPGNVSKIGGVFDIGYKNGIYESEINSKNIERILNFFNKEGVLSSRSTESAV